MKDWWLLRREPLGGGQDWLYTIFSRSDGILRVSCVNRTDDERRLPDLHQRCRGDWQSTREFPRLKAPEVTGSLELAGNNLICALYLDELLLTILPLSEPAPELFDLYSTTLSELNKGQRADVWLRLFEQRLLSHCGSGINWSEDTNGDAIDAARTYEFESGGGFIFAADDTQGWPGQILLAIADGDLRFPGALTAARNILRQAIDFAASRPLISRELLINST